MHIYRSLIFSKALDDGTLYPRWVQFFHYGLGSPVFTFYSPLPYYALDLLNRLGVAHPIGWRLLIGGGLLAACVGTYLLVYEIAGQRWPAVLAGLAYLYAPYVLRDALERGSTEAFCICLYPWVLWGLLWLARRPTPARFVVATVLWAAAIGTHVLGPLMLAPVAALLAIGLTWRYRTPAPLLALLAGGLLTAAIWLPLLQERGYVHADRGFDNPSVQPWANPLPIDHLLALPVVYDTARENNQTGDQVGLLQSILLVLGLPVAFYAWRRGRHSLSVFLGGAALLGLLLFWSFTGSADWLWRAGAPILNFLQFRTRLMGLQALAAALVAGLLLTLTPRRIQPVIVGCLTGLLILAAVPSLYINLRHVYAGVGNQVTLAEVRAAEFILEDSAMTAFGETVPRWRDQKLDERITEDPGPQLDPQTMPLAQLAEGLHVATTQVSSSRWDLDYTAEHPVAATLDLLYYPRWQARVDGQSAALWPQVGTGFAQVELPAGSHHLALRYETTPAEATGIALTGFTLLALVALLLRFHVTTVAAPLNVAHSGMASTNDGAAASQGPRLWLLVALTALLIFKVFYVDRATTWLRCVSTETHVCGADKTVSIAFNGDIRLRGYSLPDLTANRGSELRLELFWQADRSITKGQYNFVRLQNAHASQPNNPATGNTTWVEVRHEGPGGFFTTAYVPGRIYQDEYRIALPSEMPPGKYNLEVGWYDVATGDPLDLTGDELPASLRASAGALLLSTVEVK